MSIDAAIRRFGRDVLEGGYVEVCANGQHLIIATMGVGGFGLEADGLSVDEGTHSYGFVDCSPCRSA